MSITAIIFDGTAGVNGGLSSVSKVAVHPNIVAIEGMTSALNVIVQTRLDEAGLWQDHTLVNAAVPNALIEFSVTYRFVQVIGLSSSCRAITQAAGNE